VLVVDDNDDVRQFVADVLGAVYRVETARDGSEGLTKAAELHPDLVVSDLMMPHMGGDELLAAMRARPELNDTPVLLLSARADDQLRAALLRAGANDYAVKPFSPEELVARAGNLVTMKRAREVLRRELSTERGNVEALASELAQRHRELEVALGRVREALERAERASQIKTNVLNVVSHEIRTPLASSLLWLELLRRRAGAALAPPEGEAIAKAVGGVRRAAERLDSMLEYANLQSGAPVSRSPVDLRALVGEIVGGFRDEAERKGVRLLLRHPDTLPPLVTDAHLVRLLVRNLVANAVSFTPKGQVEIEVSEGASGEQGVVVRDTGPGIDPERQSVAFEPFEHQERVTHKHLRGLGLGLAIVKRAADALGGSVALHSETGRGCTITATLPSLPALPA
jgi:signal transduction histidine kinase